MRAFLLAAGKGTRLRPYTNHQPKCLIPISGKPMLAIWLELLERHGIEAALINTHHFAAQVQQFVTDISDQIQVAITLCYEAQLLGSAGTVWANRNFVAAESDFIIAYADNLTDLDLTDMIAFHRRCRRKGGVLTMGLMRAADPTACGIAELDKDNRIITFIEKPSQPKSNLANGGIYIASQALFDIMTTMPQARSDGVFDFGYHVLPALQGKMYGYEIKHYLKDIGTVDAYHQAAAEWPQRSRYERK